MLRSFAAKSGGTHLSRANLQRTATSIVAASNLDKNESRPMG